ncbi:acyl-CoA N-acyltransferase [Aspergillus stella-maris]|uniref:acyl-CoA N-acyltransferase n=1 Tax=Aspergillus stella-maris TaxID=1810926 RepID=UPI003CCE163C
MTLNTITITRGTIHDTPAVLHLLDKAVAWLASQNRTGQWGTTPFSTDPKRIERLQEFTTTGFGLWLAVDAENVTSNAEAEEEQSTSPGKIIGALALGERNPYVPPVAEPEVYVSLLVTDREWAGRGIGKQLLKHARGVAREAGVSLLRVDCYAGGDGKLVRYYEAQGFERLERVEVQGMWACQVLAERLDGLDGESST